MKRLPAILLGLFLVMLASIPQKAQAQWAIGPSYEIRDEDPTNGFGLRVERSLISQLPILDVSLRGHFSYFNDTNSLSMEGVSISRDMDVYDYGLAAVLGLKLGVVRPFAGLGVGRERFKQSVEVDEFSFKEANFYWNGFGGAEFSLLPLLNPFIEYRISRLTGTEDVEFDNVNRIAIGINMRF